MSNDDRFEAVNDEYIKFDRVENKRSLRPDLHAFLLLDELFPNERDMVCSSSHDVFYLDIEGEEIDKLTDEQVLELTRCGVMYDSECDCLSMFS